MPPPTRVRPGAPTRPEFPEDTYFDGVHVYWDGERCPACGHSVDEHSDLFLERAPGECDCQACPWITPALPRKRP